MNRKKNQIRYDRQDTIAGWIFLLPALLGLLIFNLFPILFSGVISFTEWNFLRGFDSIKFAGLKSYQALLHDTWFQQAFKNTLIIAATTTPIGIIISLIIANAINRRAYYKDAIKIMVFIPYISSIVASAIVWSLVFQPSFGIATELCKSIGIVNPPKWFQDVHWALPCVIAFTIWKDIGYEVIIFMGALKNVPTELYESAMIDGASGWQLFRKITVPLVQPTTFFLTILGVIASFKAFDQIMVLTGGGPGRATSNIALYIYQQAFEEYNMGLASASAYVMFIVILLITIFNKSFQKKIEY